MIHTLVHLHGDVNESEFFGKKGPASTLVGVTALAQPGWLIEVEAIADAKLPPPATPQFKLHEIPVVYGGAASQDLAAIAEAAASC